MAHPRAIAIGIDAAEPTLVQAQIEFGALPVLGRLAGEGDWCRVKSPSDIGSGCVWPTFLTGTPALHHGIYSHQPWYADRMESLPVDVSKLKPFWTRPPFDERRVAILDVPFAPPGSPLEILDWGSHDRILGSMSCRPEELLSLLKHVGQHPYARRPVDEWLPRDDSDLRRLVTRSSAGVRQHGALMAELLAGQSPEVLVAVFSEVHRASHVLWQTVDGRYAGKALRDSLVTLLQEVDSQVGRVLEAAGPDTTVVVFSLHGMRAADGTPTLLGPLLTAAGYTVDPVTTPSAPSWPSRVQRAVRGAIPREVKHFFHRRLPAHVASRLRLPGPPLQQHDWSRTRAFEVFSDQHGWVRINLRGREAQGIVSADEYEGLCSQLESWLGGLRNVAGVPVADRVFRTASTIDEAMRSQLPDIVVHWNGTGSLGPIAVNGTIVDSPPVTAQITGQHSLDGFCLVRRPQSSHTIGSEIRAEEIHSLLI